MTNNRGVNSFDPPVGLLRRGTIVGYDVTTNTVQVRLIETTSLGGKSLPKPVPAYFPYSDSNGAFIGALPIKGTTVTVALSSGGQYYIVNHQQEALNNIPNLQEGQMLVYTTDTSYISLDMNSHIFIGSDTNNIHAFAGNQKYPKSNLITINFENENHFNQSYREIGGLVKRDLRPNPNAASYNGSTKLEDDSYDTFFSIIGLDPTATANDLTIGSTKNPPLTEHREIVYEFQYQSNVDDDVSESNKYSSTAQATPTYSTQNRRSSRADTMSLSLVAPNFLMEEVKGTVVDIFGNILDINRGMIPVGLSGNNTLRATGTTATTNAQQSFINIRALERKSIAYHFEINARKDPHPPNLTNIDLSISANNYNAKVYRGRFSFDIDKEGQFKLNAPASSEEGNVSLLVRAENYSTFATTDNSNPNQTWFTQSPTNTGQDIYVDSFAAPAQSINTIGIPIFTQSFTHGSIQLVDGSSGADQGPVDRISQFVTMNQFNIRHGTPYHDILQTGYLFRDNAALSYPTGGVNNVSVNYLTTDIPTNAAVATSKITVSGTGANAGGRSGSINLDGSLELNIGANTIDRQSLWMDTAGGAVINLGRDTQQRSLMMDMDGHAFIQIGGYGVQVPDARFTPLGQDGLLNGILDLRVYAGGFTHIIRIDSQGIVIMSPGRVGIHGGQGLTLSSDGDMVIDCETLTIQERGVIKGIGAGSI
jgi:hypothetical protein